MSRSQPPDPDTLRFIRAVRDARFPHGIACVHCQKNELQRWGSAHGRQRYRCKCCRRTFSDLTDTPFRYCKHLARFPKYFGCMERGVTVRAAAAFLRVHPSTTFRWRHLLLRYARSVDRSHLTGIVELTTFRTWYSDKGVWGARNASYPKKGRTEERTDVRWPVSVIIARDRNGASVAAYRFADRYADVVAALGSRVAESAAIVTDGGVLSGLGRFALRHSAAYYRCRRWSWQDPASPELLHLGNVIAQIRRFRDWVARFRGVATRYLNNYLLWHGCVDRPGEGQIGTRWLLATSAPPTLPANTS